MPPDSLEDCAERWLLMDGGVERRRVVGRGGRGGRGGPGGRGGRGGFFFFPFFFFPRLLKFLNTELADIYTNTMIY